MTTRLLWCLFGMLANCVTANANLLTNGSFESPAVPTGSFTTFASGSTAISGWTVGGAAGGVAIVNGGFSQECCLFPAESGSQWLDLTGLNTNGVEGVKQTVATTIGATYALSFWIGNVYDPTGTFGTTSTVDVRTLGTGAALLGAFTNASTTPGTQVWQQYTLTFTAVAASTMLDFVNADSATDNSNGLDNVTLNVVPEPGTLLLIGLGLAGLRLTRRGT
jgi:hypothetical protein